MGIDRNIQRESLNALEIAISYNRILEECDLTQDELSKRVGKNRTTISNYIRLLKLPAEIQAALRDGTLTMGHARSLINVEKPDYQLNISRRIIKGKVICQRS
ncbi:MAG: ParB/RepB/Spo0J family partition protein [Bacteroidales bacterium]|nr:ParB/RepB/Spo0J family partition protein [Bacteroidales bacterium]